jgi:sulfate transport system substrate-binding protein
MKRKLIFIFTLSLIALFGTLTSRMAQTAETKKIKLFVVGFAVPGEAVEKEIAPAFSKKWAEEHPGEQVEFQFSWGGSSVQARNVISGLDADVVYLSDWTDVNRIQESGLITHDWNENGKGIVSKSVVVFRVNPGNPLDLKDWSDLLNDGVKLLTPNPQTSGAARWNIVALYGSILKKGGSADEAEQALRKLYRNVVTLGESGRATTQDFERGIGDVALTYENEALLFRKQGKEVEFVIPSSTIYIENPAAVVDTYADKHGVKEVAEAFVSLLKSPEAQKIFTNWGFRSIDDGINQENAERFPIPPKTFDIEFLGGWPKVQKDFFESGGLWEKIVQTERKRSR